MRIKIVNRTGLARLTQVLNADTEERLDGVLTVTLHPITPEGYLTADITVRVAELDVVADVEPVVGVVTP